MSSDRVRGGVSSMAGGEFGRGVVASHQATMSADSFREGNMMTGKMPVAPPRESFSPSGRAASQSAIRSASTGSQHFFSGGSRMNNTAAGSRSFGNPNEARGQSGFAGNGGSAAQSGHQGWQHFSAPPSGSTNHSGQGFGANGSGTLANSSGGSSASGEAAGGNQAENHSSWQHFTPPASSSREGSSNSYNSYSRPPLNMRQPIVTPRSGSNTYGARSNGSNPYGSGGPRGVYNAPRPTYSAPRNSGTTSPHSSGGGSHSGGGHSGGGGHGGGHH